MAMLTAKQQRFCDEYLVDLNATQAAIRAGYSKKNANNIASENLAKPNIREYIDKRLSEKESKLIARQDEVLKYLTAVMRREKKESVVVTVSQEESTYKPDENGTIRKHTIKSEVPEIVTIPTRISDANKAAELLGKVYSLFKDKLNVDAKVEQSEKLSDVFRQLGGEGLSE